MQIVEFTSPLLNVFAVVLFWTILQIAIPVICLKIKDKHFSSGSFFFRPRKWEKNGDIYESVFRIKKWKKLLPDGGAAMKGGFQKKHIDASSSEKLERFIVESCRGEFAHWLLILPFWIVGFFAPPIVILVMLLYSIAANIPCIIAQRYNRPRVIRLLEKMNRRVK
jgi:glycosyl-4,4'-diaponeurosporenoate acyltransferase